MAKNYKDPEDDPAPPEDDTALSEDDPALRELLKEIGGRIRQLRGRMDLSQTDLSTRSGIRRSYLNEIERLGVNISIKLLYQIAHALGVKAGDLLTDHGDEAASKDVDLAVLRQKVAHLQGTVSELSTDILKTIDETASSERHDLK